MSQKLVHVGNAMFIKPFIAGAAAAVGEKYVMNGSNNSALYFGGAVAAGIFASGTVGALLEPAVPTATSIGSMLGKSLEHRVIEVGTSSAVSFVVNNEWHTNTNALLMRVGIITAADIIAEMVVDSLASVHL